MKTTSNLVESEVRPLSSGEVLHADVEKMSMAERIVSISIVKWMIAKLTDRSKSLNERLKEDTRQVGTTNEKGHVRFFHPEAGVCTVEKRVSKSADEAALKTLLLQNSIAPDSVYDVVPQQVLNTSKLNQLVELGKLKAEDVEKLYKVTFALTVDPSEALSAQLESVAHSFATEKAIVTGKEPEPKALEEKTKSGKGKKGGKTAPTP
jgi:hypothetical protein